jgi:hypothetical protein
MLKEIRTVMQTGQRGTEGTAGMDVDGRRGDGSRSRLSMTRIPGTQRMRPGRHLRLQPARTGGTAGQNHPEKPVMPSPSLYR